MMGGSAEIDPTSEWYGTLPIWLLFLLILVIQALPLMIMKSVLRQWWPSDVDVLQEQQQMENALLRAHGIAHGIAHCIDGIDERH